MTTWKRSGNKQRRGNKQRSSPAVGVAAASGRNRDARGRLHLRLYRDASAGARVKLDEPVFAEQWQNELVESAANTALLGLATGKNRVNVVAVARQAMNALSKLAGGLLASAPNGNVACQAGCDHCCYQSVGVTMAEALVVVEHLKQTRSAEQLTGLRRRLRRAQEQRRELTSKERFSPEYPCVFLEEAQCSIYPVRPLSCRGMNALDAEACRRILRDPEARAAFLAGGDGATTFLEPIRAFHAISAGIQLGLAEIHGLDMRPLELTAAIDALLTASPATVADWLRGSSPLKSARGGDSTDNDAVASLSGLAPNFSASRR